MLETLLPEQRYFSIGEVSQLTQVKPYVIRYWEAQFGQLKPPRRDSGQRKFTQKEIDLILRIKDLLHNKRFTIAGAKRLIIQESRQHHKQLKLHLESQTSSNVMESLRQVRQDLEEALQLLKDKKS